MEKCIRFIAEEPIEIKGDEGVDLRFSYIGMQSQLHQVTSKSNVLILL